MKPPKMLPGQESYTLADLSKLLDLVGQAAMATEVFGDDELEEHARQERKTGRVEKPRVD